MKSITYLITSIIAFLFFFSLESQAQISAFNDTMMHNSPKSEYFILDGEKINITGSFLLPNGTLKAFKPISISVAKTMNIPRPTKVSDQPVVLKYKGNCYKFGCQKGEGCSDCKLAWYDRNGDGKVQPRKELRCICSTGDKCRVRVKRIECR